jgi:hypothetical protein
MLRIDKEFQIPIKDAIEKRKQAPAESTEKAKRLRRPRATKHQHLHASNPVVR